MSIKASSRLLHLRWIGLLSLVGTLYLIFSDQPFEYLAGDSVVLRVWVSLVFLIIFSAIAIITFIAWCGRVRLSRYPGLIKAWLVLCSVMFATILAVFAVEWRSAYIGVLENADLQYFEVRAEPPDTIMIDGSVGTGLDGEIKKVLLRNPRSRRIAISSDGGFIDDAAKVASLIERRNFDTAALGYCNSACLIIFMAGRRREAERGMQFGFHATSVGGPITIGGLELMREAAAKADGYLVKRGVPQSYIDKANKIGPEDLYYVTAEEMAKRGLVTRLLPKPAPEKPARPGEAAMRPK